MGARRQRLDLRQQDQIASRKRNGVMKKKEQHRRDVRMLELAKGDQLPYTPPIMSWLSVKLEKASKEITQEEVNQLLERLEAEHKTSA